MPIRWESSEEDRTFFVIWCVERLFWRWLEDRKHHSQTQPREPCLGLVINATKPSEMVYRIVWLRIWRGRWAQRLAWKRHSHLKWWLHRDSLLVEWLAKNWQLHPNIQWWCVHSGGLVHERWRVAVEIHNVFIRWQRGEVWLIIEIVINH